MQKTPVSETLLMSQVKLNPSDTDFEPTCPVKVIANDVGTTDEHHRTTCKGRTRRAASEAMPAPHEGDVTRLLVFSVMQQRSLLLCS